MTAHPGESAVERLDCGVCGVPADAVVEVTHDGAMVPRCAAHVEERPYQAEARLAEAQNEVERLLGALRELAKPVLRASVKACQDYARSFLPQPDDPQPGERS